MTDESMIGVARRLALEAATALRAAGVSDSAIPNKMREWAADWLQSYKPKEAKKK